MKDSDGVMMRSPVLAIDCSGSALDIAAQHEGRITSVRMSASQSHDELVSDAIAALLHERGLRIADLNGVIAGGGPGSFTGVRIALSLAIGICWSNRCPLVMALSPLGAAWSFRRTGHDLIVLSSAGKNLLYLTRISGGDLTLTVTDPVVIAHESDAALHEVIGEGTVVWCAEEALPVELSSRGEYPSSIASGLIGCVRDGRREAGPSIDRWVHLYDGASALSSIDPFYVRPVAAKSLRERGVSLGVPVPKQ